MRERAARHPHSNDNMKAAVAVFDAWLGERGGQHPPDASAEELAEERQQRKSLSSSRANAHARRHCSSDEEFAAHARADKNDSLKCVREAAAKLAKVAAAPLAGPRTFAFKATSFVAMFGGPGEHGYGSHTCVQAADRMLPKFRCVCDFRGVHRIQVDQDSRDTLALGKCFPYPAFVLEFKGALEEGRFVEWEAQDRSVAGVRGQLASGMGAVSAQYRKETRTQTTMMDFLKKPKRAAPDPDPFGAPSGKQSRV